MKVRICKIPGRMWHLDVVEHSTVKDLMRLANVSPPAHSTGYITSRQGRVDLDSVVSHNDLIIIVNRVFGD